MCENPFEENCPARVYDLDNKPESISNDIKDRVTTLPDCHAIRFWMRLSNVSQVGPVRSPCRPLPNIQILSRLHIFLLLAFFHQPRTANDVQRTRPAAYNYIIVRKKRTMSRIVAGLLI